MQEGGEWRKSNKSINVYCPLQILSGWCLRYTLCYNFRFQSILVGLSTFQTCVSSFYKIDLPSCRLFFLDLIIFFATVCQVLKTTDEVFFLKSEFTLILLQSELN
jgi:hypothetical protein